MQNDATKNPWIEVFSFATTLKFVYWIHGDHLKSRRFDNSLENCLRLQNYQLVFMCMVADEALSKAWLKIKM